MTMADPISEMLTLGLKEFATSEQSKRLTIFTLRKEVIEHSKFTLAIREIARIHKRGKAAGVAEGLLFVAQTGSGKTTVLQYYENMFPREQTRRGTRIPVLRVDTPEAPTVKSLAEAILFAMGDPAAAKGTATSKTNRIIHFLKECGVELLFIDEFQHFYDGRRTSESTRVTDWVKNLINRAGIPVVLSGLPRSISVVNANPQLRRRYGAPHYMQPFGFDTQDERLEFRGVLKVIQSRLPVPCIDLSEGNMAQRFYFASHGLLDYVVKIIDDAVSRVETGSVESLTQKSFEISFRRTIWLNAPDHLNPFSTAPTLRLLNKTLEPFDIWDDISHYVSAQGNKKKFDLLRANKGAA
jgi:hypothetical protein